MMKPFTTTIIILCYEFLFMAIISSNSQLIISLSQNHSGHHLSNEGGHHQANARNVLGLTTLINHPITTNQNKNQNQINPNTPPSNPNQNQHLNQINPLTPPSNLNQNQNQNQINSNPLTPPSFLNQNHNQNQNQIKTNPLSRPSNPNPNQNQNHSQYQENNIKPGRLFGWTPNNSIDKKTLLADEFLYAHNWVRRKYNLPPFIWDENLESYARKYLMQRYNDCLMIHSNGSYGENLFWGKQLHWTPSDAVYFWYMEKDLYDFKTLKCIPPPPKSVQSDTPRTCGHFTQIVWRDSTRLGCALQDCNDRSVGRLIACEYDPPGNYDDENPLEHYS